MSYYDECLVIRKYCYKESESFILYLFIKLFILNIPHYLVLAMVQKYIQWYLYVGRYSIILRNTPCTKWLFYWDACYSFPSISLPWTISVIYYISYLFLLKRNIFYNVWYVHVVKNNSLTSSGLSVWALRFITYHTYNKCLTLVVQLLFVNTTREVIFITFFN